MKPARKLPRGVVRVVTDSLWKRDQIQMKVVDACLRAVAPSPPRGTPLRKRAAKSRRVPR